jgi:hypothetical protein
MMMNLGFLRGLNFNNMNMTSIAIENKLNNPKTTLEDLLIEEDLIQEFRNSNEKLIKFFDNENIKKLVNYIILEPKEDDQIKGHKFPFVASEILSCEEKHIYNRFLLTEDELIQEKENENDHINLNSSHEMKDFLDKNIISDDKKEDNDQSNHDNNNHDLLSDTEKQNKMDLEQTEQETKKDEEKKEEKEEAKKEEEKKEAKKEEEKKEETKEEKKEEKKEETANKENKDEQKETKEKIKDKKEKEKNKDKGKKKTKKKINLNLFAVIKDLTEYTFFQKIRVIYLNSLNNPIVYYLRINMNTTIKEIINQFSSLYKYKKDRYSDKLPLNIFINGKKHSISNRTSSKYFIPTKFDYKNDYVLILEKQIFKLKEVDLGSRSNYINFKGVDVPHLVYNSVFNFEIDCLSVSKGLNFLDCKIYELKKDINLRQYTDNEHTIKQKLKEFLSLNWKDKTNFVTSFKSVKAIKSKENSYSAVLYELNRKFILLQGKMYIFVIKSNNKKLDAFYGRHISKDGVFIVSKNDKSLLSGFRGKSISDFIAYS